jgi:hypothetical protein
MTDKAVLVVGERYRKGPVLCAVPWAGCEHIFAITLNVAPKGFGQLFKGRLAIIIEHVYFSLCLSVASAIGALGIKQRLGMLLMGYVGPRVLLAPHGDTQPNAAQLVRKMLRKRRVIGVNLQRITAVAGFYFLLRQVSLAVVNQPKRSLVAARICLRAN